MSDFYLSVHKNVKFIVGKLYENNKNNYKIEEKIGIFTNKIIKMNREEFNELILRELTTEEFLNINPLYKLDEDQAPRHFLEEVKSTDVIRNKWEVSAAFDFSENYNILINKITY